MKASAQLRIGLIGAGSMGWQHAAGWQATPARLVGVLAADRVNAQRLAMEYHATVFDDLDQMLSQIDVLDVCAPTPFHRFYVERAAAAHKQIFCEKPIARTQADAEAMIAACEQAGVRLFIGMTTRFFPEYRKVHDLVSAGAIGALSVIRLSRVGYRPQKTKNNWFLDYVQSGGPLLDLLIHDFDFARWLGGEVERVYACNVSSVHPTADGDYAQVMLRFRSGIIGHIEGGWVYPPPLFRRKIDIAGQAGLIEWESDGSAPLVSSLKAAPGAIAEVGLPLSPLSEDPYTTIIKHFYQSLVEDKPFDVTPSDALSALTIALAAIESATSRQPVTLTNAGGET